MGRRRKLKDVVEGSKKKHKKKRKHYVEDAVAGSSPRVEDSPLNQRPIKLKIKLGDQLISSSDATLGDDTSSLAESDAGDLAASVTSVGGVAVGSSVDVEGSVAEGSSLGLPEDDMALESDVSVGAKEEEEYGEGEEEEEEVGEDQEEDQEEEAWLDALEAGQVNERGYLPEKRDFSSLTARQRAMLGGDGEGGLGELMELPIGRSSEELTEEMLLKKTEKNRKRRIAAQKRKEKRKAETVRKLLEKQCTKKKDEEKPRPVQKRSAPCVSYSSKKDKEGAVSYTLSLPHGVDLPMLPERPPPPPPVLCAVAGCGNIKRYADSITKLPLCSLQCYRIIHTTTTMPQSPSKA